MSDVYVVVHIATTCDESNGYVTKDSTETIELAWSVVDAESLDIIFSQSVLVRPVNTPITPYCIHLHKISWEHVKAAGTFKDAILQLDKSIQEKIISQNKDFTFVTIDVSSLRVQLPREARDKGVVLPPYLQHPRIFDLQVEYTKWQSTHPEALSYTSSSLSNIITALEVEVEEGELNSPASVGSSSLSTPPPQASGAKLSNTTTSTSVSESGVEETNSKSTINLHSKILVQLIKKSLPLEEHLTVLTRPYDSSQDVKSFLSERSKILYLSNLPSDTTQSELESWFTQYGARPIAFWTLKNFDSPQNANGPLKSSKNKGISGFAVFSSHEEAVEALGLNGKALNERAVEVQPSSTRVLDKASDLLTPFPPSKNRPRPGDWTCPSCGFSNFQRRTACFRCSFPATSAVAIQESIHPNNGMGNRRVNGGNGSNVNGSSPNSSTDKLSLNAAVINAIHASNQHYNNAAQYVSYNQDMNHNMQGHSHNHNHMHNQNRGHYGNSVPFRAGDWKCTNESCQYHNFAKNLCCLKCGMNKPLNLGNNGNQMNQQKQNNHVHSVNSTAAAIAAATASGQSLNLNTSFMGLQQPQPHHSAQLQPSLQQRQPNTNNYMKSLQQMQYAQTSGVSPRSNSNGTPQLVGGQQQNQMLNQQYMMMSHSHSNATSTAGQGQGAHSAPIGSTRQGFSPSSTSSPGLYPVFGLSQYKQPNQGGMSQLENTNSLSNGNQNINNFNSLASQLNSLNLNP